MLKQIQQASLAALGRIKHLHFVGIGGSGMSGIAEVLLNEGYSVSGSDQNCTLVTQRLADLGATIYQGHDPAHVKGVDVVVCSTAISNQNPEVEAAQQARIPVVARAEMLAELMRFRYGIAVAGTHGKTTTTSLVTSLLSEGGLDPTFVIGGLLNSAGSNAKLGASPYLVAEADESDASFLRLKPMIAIVTNIDRDHMGTYNDSFVQVQDTFIDFLHHLPFYGLAVVCIDDPVVRELLPRISRPVLTYGFSDDADWRVSDYRQQGTKTFFTVNTSGQPAREFCLNLPGQHNVLNAAAAMIVASELGVDLDDSAQALQKFAGIGRRFHRYGDLNIAGKTVALIDDYGHHPREIAVTLQAARAAWPERRIVMLFQPHRYSRTQELFDDFSRELAKLDSLLLLDVYAAGESPIAGADTPALCQSIRHRGQVEPVYVKTDEVMSTLENTLEDGDVLITQGAGSIGQLAIQIYNHFGVA